MLNRRGVNVESRIAEETMIARRAGLALGAALLFGAVGLEGAKAAAKLQVVATTAPIGDVVRQVGGDRIELQVLMGEGVDPHTYRQTRSDVAKLGRADLVLWNGLYLEAQMEQVLSALAAEKPVIALAEALDPGRLLQHEAYAGKYDPHVWMDPTLWGDLVQVTRDTLIEHDPGGRATFEANATRYLEELEDLHDYARTSLATVPEAARVVVSAHDAFRYFGKAYAYDVVGIQGLSTESEAGVRQIEELVAMLVERRIGAVFVESSVADRNVRALIEGARARDHAVTIGGELFSDAMGAPGTYEGTYLGMIDHNVTVITRALGGEAPERGRHGRLAAGS
jgi:manganese/zinc/iron transport system substrate-binding protein